MLLLRFSCLPLFFALLYLLPNSNLNTFQNSKLELNPVFENLRCSCIENKRNNNVCSINRKIFKILTPFRNSLNCVLSFLNCLWSFFFVEDTECNVFLTASLILVSFLVKSLSTLPVFCFKKMTISFFSIYICIYNILAKSGDKLK